MPDLARRITKSMLLISLGTLGGCAGSGQGLDASGRPLSEGGGSVALSADFNSLQQNVFTPICTACHAGANAPQGLRLDAANSYDLLVGVPSSEVPSILRVRPGDPNNSYLIQKLEGRAAVGAQMPFGGPPLPVSTISFIRQWIANGAPRPAAAVPGTINAFIVTNVAPANGEALAAAPRQLVVGFSADLNATRVDAASVRLERVPDAGGGDATAVSAAISVPDANGRSIIVTPAQPLDPGHYRLVLVGGRDHALTDLAGRALTTDTDAADHALIVSTFEVQAGDRP